MSLEEVRDFPDEHFNLWMGYLTLKNEESEKAAKKANKKTGKGRGGF